jgi:leucyl-tRNA synthetase
MHLYYTRFINHFLHSLGWVPKAEPFIRLMVQGMVKGQSFRRKDTGAYVPKEQVDLTDKKKPVDTVSGVHVVSHWEKMSKSKHNGVDPYEMFDQYGVDTTRLLLLNAGDPTSEIRWPPEYDKGIFNLEQNTWLTVGAFRNHRVNGYSGKMEFTEEQMKQEEEILYKMHMQAVKMVNHSFRTTYLFNNAVRALFGLMRTIRSVNLAVLYNSAEYERALASLLVMLSPIMPHFSSEMWTFFQNAPKIQAQPHWDHPLFQQPWPDVHMDFPLSLKLQVNYINVGDLDIPRREMDVLPKDQAFQMAFSDPRVSGLVTSDTMKFFKYELWPSYGGQINFVTKDFRFSQLDKMLEEKRKRDREEKKANKRTKQFAKRVREML